MTAFPVTLEDVRAAEARIAPIIDRTPVMVSRHLDERAGCQVFLKCENLQRVGAFKMRGATNAISLLSPTDRSRGVITHSSGNHAQAVALAGKLLGARVTVVMPENAPRVKREATEEYGAKIVFCKPTLAAREEATKHVIESIGATLVHAYDDPNIIAGQGTAALELLEEVEDLDYILTPVGGGGLLSGTAVAATGWPDTTVVGCEPAGADDAYRSLTTGTRVTEHTPKTICDGLLTTLGKLPFQILTELGVEIVCATDEEIREAMLFALERTKQVIEPSAAVPLAAVLHGKLDLAEKRVGVILSGGNVDLKDWVDSL